LTPGKERKASEARVHEEGPWAASIHREEAVNVEQIHEFRKEVDALILKAEGVLAGDNVYGREMALVRTKLQEAKMWAGQCLAVMGNHLPPAYRDFAENRK
jgi:hypothetical protein